VATDALSVQRNGEAGETRFVSVDQIVASGAVVGSMRQVAPVEPVSQRETSGSQFSCGIFQLKRPGSFCGQLTEVAGHLLDDPANLVVSTFAPLLWQLGDRRSLVFHWLQLAAITDFPVSLIPD